MLHVQKMQDSYRVSGTWDGGVERKYGDFCRDYMGRITNLLEVNDDGDLICAVMDMEGDYDYMDVKTYDKFDLDFVIRFLDPSRFMGEYI